MSTQLIHFAETPSQTGGPYVHIGLASKQAGFDIFENNFGNVLTKPDTLGERIRIEGHVYDGTGTVIRDALLEIWQANAAGKYKHPADKQDKPLDPSFRGWGRTGADFETGLFNFETIKPGAVPLLDGRIQAPHVCVILFARGVNIGLHTRMYFDDEVAANAQDPIINGIEWEVRRPTLIAKRQVRDGQVVYRFDIRIQDTPDGGLETVFFDV
jgi:protocatechuate 3,4-dioxygenase alpha subunit